MNSKTTSDFFSDRVSTSSAKEKRIILNQLRNVWNEELIDFSHQIIVEEYLDHLSTHLLEAEAQYEIELTKSKRSFLFTLGELSKTRNVCLEDLHLKVKVFEKSSYKVESQVAEICQLMKKLRQINLVYTQTLLNIHHYFNRQIGNQIPCLKIMSLFRGIHEDNDFLAKSLLRKYIIFSKSYDPFYLKHYQLLKNTNNPRLKELQSIEELFQIPINEVFRLTKAQEEINKYFQKSNSGDIRKTELSRKRYLSDYEEGRSSPKRSIRDYLSNMSSQFDRRVYLNQKTLLRSNRKLSIQKDTVLATKQTSSSVVNSERKKSIQSEPKKEILYFPKINSICSNQSIEEEISQQQGSKEKTTSISPQRKKKKFDKSIDDLQAQDYEFKKYVLSKRFHTMRERSEDPDVRIRRNTLVQANFDPEKYLKTDTPNTIELGSRISNSKQQFGLDSLKISREDDKVIEKRSFLQQTSNYNSQFQTIQQENNSTSLSKRLQKSKFGLNEKNNQKQREVDKQKSEPNKQKNQFSLQKITQQANELSKQEVIKNIGNPGKRKLKKVFPIEIQKQFSPNRLRNDEFPDTKTKEKLKEDSKLPQKTISEKLPKRISKEKLSEGENRYEQMRYKLRTSEKQETVDQIIDRLRNYKINPEYREKLQFGNWKNSISHNQYYFHKSFVNQKLQAISLCCALPDGDMTIKYWGPLDCCDKEMSNFLFSKYLDHLEKNTLLRHIYFNGNFIRELTSNNFIIKKQRIFVRDRVKASLVQSHGYPHFLEIQFSNVGIRKITEGQDHLVVQENAQLFQSNKFVIFNYLLIINKLMAPGVFSQLAHYHPKITLPQAKETLLSHYLPVEAYNWQFKCDICNLLILKLRTTIRTAFFIADKGFLLLSGSICIDNGEHFIVCLQMLRLNTKMYFGKGFKDIHTMVSALKTSQNNGKDQIQFIVRMFKKNLRGKINGINLKEENCYGDLLVNFVWKDYLKGKIAHSMTDCYDIFDQQFFCLIETEKEILFAFEVLPENFVNPE